MTKSKKMERVMTKSQHPHDVTLEHFGRLVVVTVGFFKLSPTNAPAGPIHTTNCLIGAMVATIARGERADAGGL
jgi:hypothetical protein